MRNFKGSNNLDLRLFRLNEQEYTEMQKYVETLISRRQPFEEIEDKSIETLRLKESYNQFKLPKFNPIKLEGKKVEYKEEREFLLKFAKLAKDFS